jgi:hypothetical protein
LIVSSRLFPKVVSYDAFTDYRPLCGTLGASPASDTTPRYSLDALRNFAGTQVPEQRPPTLSRRLLDFLKSRF